MHILTVLYGHPHDPDAFDTYYTQKHVPLVDPIPGLKGWTYRHVASMDENPPPYYLIAELTFDSLEDLQAGMGGPEGQAAAGDVPNFASGGATMMIAHD
jgi:uncharacterized protein (TIGR02118 family)